MSRLRRFTHSVLSGYFLIGASAVYTLASVPLALSYLTKAEFGLWAVTSMIAQYIGLLDLGMSGASRILVDHKDEKNQGVYGSVIQTFVLVSVAQAGLILLLGLVVAAGLGPLLHIPAAQQTQFFWLTIGQCVIAAANFLTRVLLYLPAAHQRYDIVNYTQSAVLVLCLGVLWFGFAHHQGVYSTLSAQAVGWLVTAAILLIAALNLKLLPARGCWGRPTWEQFRELFSYGRDIFLCAVGYQLLNASQTLVLTRMLGLDVAAVWSVCTRTYFFLSQVIFRLLDYSGPTLAEMMVRNETERLCRRFKSLLVASASLAVVAGVLFAVCNQPFLRVWTQLSGRGSMGWPPVNDTLLAVWLVVLAAARCHIGLVGQAKQIGAMRYIYLLEGAFFVGLSLLVVRWGGISAMVAAGITGTLLITWPYGAWRSSRYFHLPWQTVAVGWVMPPFRLALCLVPFAALVAWLASPLPDRSFLLVFSSVTALASAPLLFRFGLDEDLRRELSQRFFKRLRPMASGGGTS